MGYSRSEMVAAAHDAGFTSASERLVTEWQRQGFLDEPERVARGRGNGTGARYEWPENQKDLFICLLQQRPGLKQVAGLSQVPVGAWMYWGDEWVPIRQVRRALQTWWDRAGHLRSWEKTIAQARLVVNTITGPGGSMKSRSKLRDEVATSMDSGVFDGAVLEPLVEQLLKTQPGQLWGPYGFDAVEVVDMMRCFSLAMTDYDETSDGAFYEVRARHRQMVVQYVRDQPMLTTHQKFGSWFSDLNFEFLINNSCRDMLLGLGSLKLAAEYGRSLGPVPLQEWKHLPQELKTLPIK